MRISSSDLPEYMQPAMTCSPVNESACTSPSPLLPWNMAVYIGNKPPSATPHRASPLPAPPGNVNHEPVLVPLGRLVPAQFRQLPLVSELGKIRVAFHHGIHFGQVDDVRMRQERLVN